MRKYITMWQVWVVIVLVLAATAINACVFDRVKSDYFKKGNFLTILVLFHHFPRPQTSPA